MTVAPKSALSAKVFSCFVLKACAATGLDAASGITSLKLLDKDLCSVSTLKSDMKRQSDLRVGQYCLWQRTNPSFLLVDGTSRRQTKENEIRRQLLLFNSFEKIFSLLARLLFKAISPGTSRSWKLDAVTSTKVSSAIQLNSNLEMPLKEGTDFGKGSSHVSTAMEPRYFNVAVGLARSLASGIGSNLYSRSLCAQMSKLL